MQKIIGVSLIVISILSFISIKTFTYYESYNHSKTIDSIFINGKPNNTNYIGYINIDRVNIKRGIVNGVSKQILDNNDVGMISNNNIILAGHAVDNVFAKLFNVKINDTIDIYLYDILYKYKVYKKVIVEKDNFEHLNNDLVLITCTNDDKRLLVIAKKDI